MNNGINITYRITSKSKEKLTKGQDPASNMDMSSQDMAVSGIVLGFQPLVNIHFPIKFNYS